jgi:hypothetical protein
LVLAEQALQILLRQKLMAAFLAAMQLMASEDFMLHLLGLLSGHVCSGLSVAVQRLVV